MVSIANAESVKLYQKCSLIYAVAAVPLFVAVTGCVDDWLKGRITYRFTYPYIIFLPMFY